MTRDNGQCACVNAIHFAPLWTSTNLMVLNMAWNKCFFQGACAIVKYVVPRHTWMYHMEEITRTLCNINRNDYKLCVELSGWKGSVTYGLGADLSLPPCLSATTGIWALTHKKRPPGRNLGEHRSVRRSGTASRGTALLVLGLRMRSILRTEVLTTFLERSVRAGSTEFLTPLSSIYAQ